MFYILRKSTALFYTSVTAFFLLTVFSMHLYYDSKEVSVIANTVIIDAGHGGEDGGAVGKSGSLEKDLNLAIAKKLKAKLAESGFNVIMTREEDVMLSSPDETKHKKRSDLNNRVKISRMNENGIFISIHMNYFDSPDEKGAQIFYSPNHERSALLARCIEAELKSSVDSENKRVSKAAGKEIFLMKHIKTPACIVECGFISNREEEKMLNSPDYQDKIATAILEGIKEYISKS